MKKLSYHPLSSGSKGNVTILSSKDTTLLIDCGLGYKQLLDRLHKAETLPEDIDAILITHEHSDHIKGLEVFCKRHQTPVLCTSALALHLKNDCGLNLNYKIFSKEEPFMYGSIQIDPFTVSHDAVDPVAFVFTIQGYRIGHCTDLGFVSSLVAKKLEGCHVLLLESNHDVGMVHSSTRPVVYKKRVLSRLGHLSNEASSELVEYLHHEGLKRLYLGHLSEECNHPDKALAVHNEALQAKGKVLEIKIAKQHEISEEYDFSAFETMFKV